MRDYKGKIDVETAKVFMGHPCGQSFVAKGFLEAHPEYDYQKEYLRDMPGQKWFLTEKIKNR